MDEINELIDYIDNDLMDAIDAFDIKQFSYDVCLKTLDYLKKKGSKDELDDLKFYLCFTDYNDLFLKSIDILVSKYPKDGYELDYAISCMDSNPKKAVEISIEVLKKTTNKKAIGMTLLLLFDIYKKNKELVNKYCDLSIVDYKDIDENELYYRDLLIGRR